MRIMIERSLRASGAQSTWPSIFSSSHAAPRCRRCRSLVFSFKNTLVCLSSFTRIFISTLCMSMPPAGPGQEAPPDFATHPHFQHLFETLVTGGQTREQASLLLSDLWQNRIHNNAPQQLVQPQPADPQQHQARQGPQPGQADPHDPEQANPAQEPQQPLPPPLPNRDEHPEQPQDLEQGQDQHPLALGPPQVPLDAPPLPSDDLDRPTQHKTDKRAVQLHLLT